MQDSKRLELMGKGLAWENVTKAKTNSAGHALLEIAPRVAAMEIEVDRLRILLSDIYTVVARYAVVPDCDYHVVTAAAEVVTPNDQAKGREHSERPA